ncbi:MAG: hypothetical protein A2Y25_09935 [Candidatus Melainabacteria bacterium GWF2_37_15]|nr:MAG: hypothetical protein A2Y25_09935 [Candidatus Melainabacteria bacterium GWF2_37_15]
MSIARDDIGYLNALDALETSFIKTGTIEKKEHKEEVSGKDNTEPEINDVYEKNSNIPPKDKEIEKVQEDYKELEIKNNNLKKINADLEQIHKIINNNEQEDNKETQNPDYTEKREQALSRIQELMSKVNEKQAQIAQLQQEIQSTVSSLVELNIGENVDSVEAEIKHAEELKQDIIKDIKENPETVKKLEIKNIDKDLLLALLSLHK